VSPGRERHANVKNLPFLGSGVLPENFCPFAIIFSTLDHAGDVITLDFATSVVRIFELQFRDLFNFVQNEMTSN
jgi:hypothetical protein